MRPDITPSLFLDWGRIAYYLSAFITQALGKRFSISVTVDELDYWSAQSDRHAFTQEDLRLLLTCTLAQKPVWDEAIPVDSEETGSLGLELSRLVLKSAIHADWECEHITRSGLYLIGVELKDNQLPDIPKNYCVIDGRTVDVSTLLSGQQVLESFRTNGFSITSLMDITERYLHDLGFEPYWHYPVETQEHCGAYLLLVSDGVLLIPYTQVGGSDFEIFDEDKISLMSHTDAASLIWDWKQYSREMETRLCSLYDFLRNREIETENET